MTELERLNFLRREDVIAALRRIDEEGIPKKRISESMDLVHEGRTYPPYYVISLAGFFSPRKQFISSKWISKNRNSPSIKYLKNLGFDVRPKSKDNGRPPNEIEGNIHYKYVFHEIDAKLNENQLKKAFESYLDYCNDTDWLSVKEAYKFKFGRWLNERIDFSNQTDQEILDVCLQSQDIKYYENEKGINFIKTAQRYQDSFISLKDIQIIRKLYEGELMDESDMKASTLSSLKFSIWAATILPEKFRTIANDSLFDGLNYLFDFNLVYKRGVRYFNLVNTAAGKILNAIRNDYEQHIEKLLQEKLSFELPLRDIDWVWLTQDFILYLVRVYDMTNTINEEKDDNIQFREALKAHSEEDLRTYFGLLKEIFIKNSITRGSNKICLNYNKRSLRLTVGQRYAWCLFVPDHPRFAKFLVLSADALSESSKKFSGNEPLPFYTEMNEFNPDPEQLESIHNGIATEYKRTNKSSYSSHNKRDFENYLFELMNIESANGKVKHIPKNTILYGPPGTGKTYSLKNDLYDEYTSRETSLSKEEFFEEVVRDLTWWQVIGLALLEANEVKVSEILTNRWVSKKADLSESKNVRATIWGTLQMHTVEESETVLYKQRQMPLIFDKNKDKSWKILKSELDEQAPELFEIRDKVNNFNPQSDKLIKRYVFTTFHQSFSYEDFIEGIKPVISDVESDAEGSVAYHIEDGIFKKLCERAKSDPDHRYAIFIDEINRGNVSAIFGELISLIEPDKRKGQENELVAELPYSKKEFSVPSNVDIYGTMNTADRSVEALDTALRRRFSFLEYMPKPELLADKGENGNGTVAGINLVKLLSTINDRIEVLIDRDHTIGHAYFMSVKNIKDLRSVFKNRIIPLLQEYFYSDYAKIEMVIGPDFFEKKAIPEVKFATEAADYQLEGFVYHIRNPESEDFDMEKALRRLLDRDNEE